MRSLKQLRPYQKRVCNFMIRNPKNFLILGCGIGKTVISLAVFNELKYNRLEVFKALVIGPPRVIQNTWSDEVKEWEELSHLTVTPIVGHASKRRKLLKENTDIHTISAHSMQWLCEEFPGKLPYDWVIFDESSMFKSPDAARFKYVKNRIRSNSRVSLLTGTPATNSTQDLWSQVYLLDAGERLGRTITSFRNSYCSAKIIPGTQARAYSVDERSGEVIMEKIKDLAVSLKTEDYVDLPDLQIIDTWVTMDEGTKERYEEFKKEKVLELIESEEPITAANAAALVTKLRQFANGFVYSKNEDLENVSNKVHDLKLEALAEIVDSAHGSPILCAYMFKSDKDDILKKFKKLKPEVLGSGKTAEDQIKRWNSGGIKMLLTHPASAAHGLNLQKGPGNIIVYYGLPWQLELYIQLNNRIHRSGQKNKMVLIYRILCRGTVDAKIKLSLEDKASGQNAMIDFVKDNINEFRESL